MGEARRKLIEAAKLIKFDFGAPKFIVGSADMAALDSDLKKRAGAMATRRCIVEIVRAAFPQGMGRVDGKVWAAWLEDIENDDKDEEIDRIDIPMTQITWLRKHAGNDDIKIQIGMAQWREALVTYLDSILDSVHSDSEITHKESA